VVPMVKISNPLVLLNTSNFNLSMKCIPDSADHQYEWRRRIKALPTRAKGIFSSQMTIFNAQPKDSGKYRCIISNSTGKIVSAFSTLKVKGKISVLRVT